MGAITGSGLVGRGCGRAASGFEQVHPLVFAVPAFWEVEGDVAAGGAGDAGGDGDQVAAERGGAGFGVGEAGQGAGGAGQVERDGGGGQPGGVGRN